jgi:DMSO/TMAO reductase YedYZ molybdopterin-dependent catalytic subunit
MSRRGALALVGGGSALLAALSIGQVLDGPARGTALLLPRGRVDDSGFPVNRTAAAAGVVPTAGWRLALTGATPRTFSRAELAALPQHTARLPIACVEGWSTVQTWTGVRLRDLAALAGVPQPASAFVASLEAGPFAQGTLNAGQVLDPDALLALQVNGADLSLDHGFPARIIVPAAPGVRCTKWVRSIDFREA